ncbi:MAG: phosphatidylglycerol lysyltransferase domain-containing protein [Oscillospiraceae bacterium]|nr:phosphatidylglycerol lysyltransferase domain-containing protein [Oscillospiraceae bacterium]
MIEFKGVELSDGQWAKQLLSYSGYRGCEYTFGNNFIWQGVFYTKIARYKDFYLIKSGSGGYFFPAGRGEFSDAVSVLRDDAAKDNRPLNFVTMNKASMEWLKEEFPGEFEFSTNRDFYDYVYNFTDLSELAGKKYHSKRNFINRFKENNWKFEPISPQNILECAEMNEQWLKEYELADKGVIRESCVVNMGLQHFFDLGLSGGLLRVDGEVAAFTFGEPASSDTFVVHAEKAFTKTPSGEQLMGAYPTINQEFVNYACTGYTFINREEDIGHENLRKAKMSYHPVFLEEKYKATSK